MTSAVVLALDFDGTLVEAHSKPLRWRPRAKDFLLACAGAGVRLWLHSCRCAAAVALDRSLPGDAEAFWRFGRVPDDLEYSWSIFNEMRAFLEAEGVWGLLQPWTLPGKPIADLYPDDLGERPDWLALAGELGLALGHADEGRDRQVVPPGPAPLVISTSAPAPAAGGPIAAGSGRSHLGPPSAVGDLDPGSPYRPGA
jgi:hypothetical protein